MPFGFLVAIVVVSSRWDDTHPTHPATGRVRSILLRLMMLGLVLKCVCVCAWPNFNTYIRVIVRAISMAGGKQLLFDTQDTALTDDSK